MIHEIDGVRYSLSDSFDLDRHLLEGGVFEPHIQWAAKPYISIGCHVLDVGANAGFLSLAFARMGANVEAFEPDKEVFSRLVKNLYLNDSERFHVTLHRIAMQDQDVEFVRLNKRRAGGNDGISSIEPLQEHVVSSEFVPCCTIDRLFSHRGIDKATHGSLGGKLELIKIDVEGAESKVLKGAAKTIRQWTPAIIWEHSTCIDTAAKTSNTQDAFEFLRDAGYRQWIIDRSCELIPMDEYRPWLDYADILAVHKNKVKE